MDKLHIPRDISYTELDLGEFNKLKYGIYLIDFNWNYIFVNDFVRANLGERGQGLAGKNMWATFTELAEDFTFTQLKQDAEKGLPVNFITTSPITRQRVSVKGYSLKDCYLFYSSILPQKEDLLNELRNSMKEKTISEQSENSPKTTPGFSPVMR